MVVKEIGGLTMEKSITNILIYITLVTAILSTDSIRQRLEAIECTNKSILSELKQMRFAPLEIAHLKVRLDSLEQELLADTLTPP